MKTSDSIKAISAALFKVQSELHGVVKDAQNPHFRNRYATLEAVIDTAKPALQSAGVLFIQAPGNLSEHGLEVTTRLVHTESGEWIESNLVVPLAKNDPQGAGSAITYACRYSLMAMLGLPPVDDDAEAAVGRPAGNITQGKQPTSGGVLSAAKAQSQNATASTADAYVALAKTAITGAKTKQSLIDWWAAEKPNRDKHKLKPNEGPGLDLVMAYNDKKDAFDNSPDLLMAG